MTVARTKVPISGRGNGLVLVAVLSVAVGACAPPIPDRASLVPRANGKQHELDIEPGFRFAGPSALEEFQLDDEGRRVLVGAADPWSWRGRIGPRSRLVLGAALLEAPLSRLEVKVERVRGESRDLLARVLSRRAGWLDVAVDLSRFAGDEIELRVTPRVIEPAGAAGTARQIAWGPVVVDSPPVLRQAQPNVLLIVVDTLRADHLTSYGYERSTSVAIESHLASRGVLVERAYAQAPWTLPSMVSLLTSRYPGEILGEDMRTFGVPDPVPTLAAWMQRQGYRTAGFIANRTLHAGNGFARGFATFSTPSVDADPMLRPAEDINRRARPWLRAYQHEPFFLYLHYLDPHDPYDNPELSAGRSPYFPEYAGGISGLWMQGIYNGQIALPDPAADIRHLTALYDSEIHYVDARIGELLDGIAPEVLANTLIVFTADHGEELYDHAGWKHGQTLYDEQIRVPLILRWDGRLPAGRRLAGPARLLDIVPTVAAAVKGTADPSWQGVNLLPALAGETPFPRLPVFSQHHASGPLRAAAILDGKKLLLFNHRAPFAPGDGLQAFLWRQDLARLQRAEWYDLDHDPGEKQSLALAAGAAENQLETLRRQLDRQLPGIRIMASGLGAGGRVEGTLEFDRRLDRFEPYFLADGDRVVPAGSEGRKLRFSLAGDGLEKGFLVEGQFAELSGIEADFRIAASAAAVPVLLGPGRRYTGGTVPTAWLATTETPALPAGPAIRIWLRPERMVRSSAPEDAETLARLRALGYVQ
jgi:arylsulfatase A-like enzyme